MTGEAKRDEEREQDDSIGIGGVTLSSAALSQIEGLPVGEQRSLSQGLVEAYSKSLDLLVRNALQCFIHRDELTILEKLRSGMVVYNIHEYAFRISVCRKTYSWHVNSVGLPGSLRGFEIVKIERKSY